MTECITHFLGQPIQMTLASELHINSGKNRMEAQQGPVILDIDYYRNLLLGPGLRQMLQKIYVMKSSLTEHLNFGPPAQYYQVQCPDMFNESTGYLNLLPFICFARKDDCLFPQC